MLHNVVLAYGRQTNEVLNRLIGCQPSHLDNWISKYQQCQFQSTSLKVSSIASLDIFGVTGDRRKPEIPFQTVITITPNVSK